MSFKKWLILLMVVAMILTLDSPIFGVNGRSNRATLRGLKGVGILVEQLPPEVEREGLVRNQLQVETESKLRMAGVKVLTKEECSKTPGEPYLYININVNLAKTESEIYPYTIDAMLIQKVSLLQAPEQITYAVTWSTGGVGSIGKPILSQLRESVAEVVDLFINAYLGENPK